MAFLLSVAGLLIVLSALAFLLTRHRGTPAPADPASSQPGSAPGPTRSAPWTRGERIALASLVVGTVLGVLGLLAR